MKIKRNEHCPCDSGKKFKKCHLNTQLGQTVQGNYGKDFINFIINKMKEKKDDK